MKNISLQMNPATALKTAANKSESNNDQSVSAEPSAFKTILANQLQNQAQTRQLQDRNTINKRSQDRQLQDRQLNDKQLQARQDLSKQNTVKPELASLPPKSQLTSSLQSSSPQSTSELAEKVDAEQDSVAQISAAKALVDNAAGITTSMTRAETVLTDAPLKVLTPAINAAETNAANLMAAFNVAVVNPQAQAKIAEAAGFRQKNIDNVVSQTLAQTKAVAGADTDALQFGAESKASTQKANLLDGGLPTAVRQAVGDALTQSKALQIGVQQNIVQQNVLQQASAQQTSQQQNSTQQSSMQQNLAQQAVNIAATTMPTALQANAAAGPALASAQAGSSNYINASLGKSGWDQAISQKVMWMAGGGVQSATLTLNPPDLGPLQVVINVNNDMVEAKFMSDNADVRQALQDGLENLRDKMNEAGIQLGQTNISAGGQSQQQFQQAQQGRRGERMAVSEAMTATAQTVNVRTANGLVDTFA